MHDTAHEHARLFFELYWQPDFAVVAELGSYDVNGRLRDHAPAGTRYIGFDMAPGPLLASSHRLAPAISLRRSRMVPSSITRRPSI